MAKQSSTDTARRLIALLGHFQNEAQLPLATLAEKVGVSPAQLADDLATLSVCGVAPYYPDMMVDVFVEDGIVEVVTPLPAIKGAVRLSAAEAEALSAALAAAGYSADEPLTEKLLAASSAGFDAEGLAHTLRTETAAHDSGIFETVAGAIAASEAVAITYQRDGATAPSARTIEPHRLIADRGAWYVTAYCRSAGENRTFRVDRIRSAEAIGEHFVPATPALTAAAFTSEGLPLARLRFTPSEAFIEREWPGGRVIESAEDGSTLAEVPFGGTGWIARAVAARLGAVEVLEPSDVREAVRVLAQERVGELA